MTKIGSACTGYGGLDMAVTSVLGGELAWYAEIEPAAVALLEHHHPGVPNIGDLTTADWGQVEPVDTFTAGWPCFAAGTVVLTARGAVPIEQVRTGDLVLTHRNRWRPVLATGSRTAPIQEVRAQGVPPIRTTGDHPFYVRDFQRYYTGTRRLVEKWGDPEWAPANSIVGRRIAVPAEAEALPAPPWPFSPWLVGRWVADGWGNAGARQVCFGIGKDKAEKFRAELSQAGLTAGEYDQGGSIRFTVGRTDAIGWLTHNFGIGAEGKTVPGWLLSHQDRAEWLDGYLSGDGFEHDGASWSVSISRSLAVSVAVVGATLGYAPQVKLSDTAPTTIIQGRTVNQRPWFRTGLRHQSARQFIRWMDGAAWGLVRSSTLTGEVDQVWNLHVDEDNSYTADGAVVHNCQPWSVAGKQKGEADERAIWPDIARAIRHLRPRNVVLENVPRVIVAGELARALGDLAACGFDAEWTVLPASGVGAAHRRERLFIAATHPDEPRPQGRVSAETTALGRWDAEQQHLAEQRAAERREPAADTAGDGRGEGRPEPTRVVGGSDAAECGDAATNPDSAAGRVFAGYGAAVERWEHVLGRRAPAPTVLGARGGPKLNPGFVEFLMGLPAGWVTDVPGLSLNEQLKLLGNGVVPQQAEAALRHLWPLVTDVEMAA